MVNVILLVIVIAGSVYLFSRFRAITNVRPMPAPKSLPTHPAQKQHTPIACSKCNPYEPCSQGEEFFCMAVLKRSLAKDNFVGQHWVNVEGKRYRLDFAINPHGTPRIAVELDGFAYHAGQIARERFDNHLERQNKLAVQGWKVLRFSYDQIKNNPNQCIAKIDKIIEAASIEKNQDTIETAPSYTEFAFVKAELGKRLETCGAVYSSHRNSWYFPFGCDDAVLTGFANEHKPVTWRQCRFCDGEAHQRANRSTGERFWSCQKCKKTFNGV